MAASAPYFFFYPADYLADTAHLTRGQHGSYLLLLMNYWQTGKALNNASERLAVVAKASSDEWENDKQVLSEFFDIEDDLWIHGRMDHDLSLVRAKSIQASYAGRLGGLAGKKKPEADAKRTLSESQAMNECMNEEIKEKNFVQTSFERFWEIYPRRDGKKDAVKAIEKALKIVDIETILNGVNRYKEFLKTTTQQTAMPASWLNKERWNDELKPASSVSKFEITSPTPIPPRLKEGDLPSGGVPMPENVRKIALGRAV